jgi:hypothetical protein
MSEENIIAESTIEALPTNDEEEKEIIEIDVDELRKKKTQQENNTTNNNNNNNNNKI